MKKGIYFICAFICFSQFLYGASKTKTDSRSSASGLEFVVGISESRPASRSEIVKDITEDVLKEIYAVYKTAFEECVKKEDVIEGQIPGFSIQPESSGIVEGVQLQFGSNGKSDLWARGGCDTLRCKLGAVILLNNYRFKDGPFVIIDENMGLAKGASHPISPFDTKLSKEFGLTNQYGKSCLGFGAFIGTTKHEITLINGRKIPRVAFAKQWDDEKDKNEYKSKCMKFEDQEDPEFPRNKK